jgi:hypothetical protein
MQTADCRVPNDAATPLRGKAVWGGHVRLIAMLTAALVCAGLLTSCSEAVRSGQGSSYLVLASITGPNGTPVSSDVISNGSGTCVSSNLSACTVLADTGSATFQLQMKDVLSSPTANNAITLTQYHVEYVRADGHNVQGVDVPYAFDGGLAVTVAGTGSVNFTLVRIQAKEEAPLKGLRFGGGAIAIGTIARITFYGHDQTGREVSVSGNVDVTFSDWAG